MFKIKFIAKQFVVSLLLLCLIVPTVWANVIDSKNHTSISKDQLKERIDQLPSEIDLRYTSEVHKIINTYIRNYRRGSEQLLGRVERYFPIYEHALQKSGIPNELKYISVVESALRPRAVSHSGAVGLWQFIKGTGKLYGLRINSVVDERRDPVRSTEAATAYLKDLYAKFGDWTLAMAAYNCGPGNVNKALRRSQGDEFWEIKNYLPRETRQYIPRYVAISYVMNYFQFHGLEPALTFSNEKLATVRIFDYVSFREISKMSGVDMATVAELNPSYLKGYIPKNSDGYYLTLPEEKLYTFLARVDYSHELVVTVNSSDRLRQKLALYSSMKKKAQEVRNIDQLPVNHMIPLKKNSDLIDQVLQSRSGIGDKRNKTVSISQTEMRFHKLQTQQSLIDVANMYGTKLVDLIAWNELDMDHLPPPGSLIKIKVLE